MCILCVRVKINKRSFEPFCVWIPSLCLSTCLSGGVDVAQRVSLVEGLSLQMLVHHTAELREARLHRWGVDEANKVTERK